MDKRDPLVRRRFDRGRGRVAVCASLGVPPSACCRIPLSPRLQMKNLQSEQLPRLFGEHCNWLLTPGSQRPSAGEMAPAPAPVVNQAPCWSPIARQAAITHQEADSARWEARGAARRAAWERSGDLCRGGLFLYESARNTSPTRIAAIAHILACGRPQLPEFPHRARLKSSRVRSQQRWDSRAPQQGPAQAMARRGRWLLALARAAVRRHSAARPRARAQPLAALAVLRRPRALTEGAAGGQGGSAVPRHAFSRSPCLPLPGLVPRLKQPSARLISLPAASPLSAAGPLQRQLLSPCWRALRRSRRPPTSAIAPQTAKPATIPRSWLPQSRERPRPTLARCAGASANSAVAWRCC